MWRPALPPPTPNFNVGVYNRRDENSKNKMFPTLKLGVQGGGASQCFQKQLQGKLKLSFAPSWGGRPVFLIRLLFIILFPDDFRGDDMFFQSGRFPLEQQQPLPLSVTC